MRNKLETEIINILFPYRKEIPMEDVKAQIRIVLSDYEVEARKTEIIVRDEDKNNQYIAMFLASKMASGRTNETLRFYKGYLTKIFGCIGKNADEVTPDDIKLYLAKKLRIDKCTKTSVDNERRALSSFYSWMQTNEHITKNPMNKVEVMKYNKPKQKAFTDMEVEKLRSVCQTERQAAVIEILLSTWCRVSELVGMRIDEIEDDKIIVHGKGEKDRYVFLNAKAQLALQKYLEQRNDNNPYIFPKMARSETGKPMWNQKGYSRCRTNYWYTDPKCVDEKEPSDKGTIENMVREMGKKAGINKVHPHRFRRTGATFALRTGMPLMTISKLLGHANIAVTQVYLDINDEDLEAEHGKYVR